MSEGTTIMLAALSTVLILYVIQHERKSSRPFLSIVGLKKKKPVATLGASGCNNVSIDSPDFARCSTTLGSGRSVLRSRPRGDNIVSTFTKDNYAGEKLGNPFSVRSGPNLGSGEAFPFSSKSGDNVSSFSEIKREASGAKGSAKTKLLGDKKNNVRGQNFVSNIRQKTLNSLGAAVSPSSTKLGASAKDIAQATNKLKDTNTVSSNSGGNLNLLHPL